MKPTLTLLSGFCLGCIVSAAERPDVLPLPDKPARPVSAEDMARIHDEVKTPFKYGIVIPAASNEAVDGPKVFRRDGRWYMIFVSFRDKIGYETHLAVSDDLLKWDRLGKVLPFREEGWDSWQGNGAPALVDYQWNGTHEIGSHEGRYWMSYVGGNNRGYEPDPLSIGLASTDNPVAVRTWDRFAGNPILSGSHAHSDARPFESLTLYTSTILRIDPTMLGYPFVMFYNGKTPPNGHEAIGMAVSSDLREWRRLGPGPLVDNQGESRRALTGNPQIVKIGDLWVMFYFGAGWKPNAFDTFAASHDLVTWTKWEGEHLVQPSEPYDKQFAHKPWVLKHDGVVYHFYCAVGEKGRVIALATSKDLRPASPVKVTQELLNSIHVTPKLIFDPFPLYAQKYLPFAMAASMESTHKGRLWTCWAGGQDGPNAYLLASYSDDQGRSWRDPVFVIDPQAHGLKMGTRLGSFWCDPKGRLWLFFHQSVGMFDGSCSNWFVRCDDPDAEKPVWTRPVYIGFGASLNKPIVRKNGEWILPVSLWERWHIDKPFADCYHELDAVRGANVFVSDDEGSHWRYRGGIIYQDSCFNEHTVAELKDGRLWMLSRGMKATFQSFSTDGGKTWQPQTTFFPHVNSKAVIRRLQSGHLLVIRHGQDITKATPKRQELTAFLSTDEGKTWSGKLLLDERTNVSYPDIAQAPNGDIYVHYDRDRYGAAEILFARFREEDVQAGKLVSKDAALKNLVKSKLAMNHGSSGYKGKDASAAVPVVSPLEAKLAKFREDLPLMLVPPRVREFNDPKLLDGRQHVAYPGIARTTQGRLWVCWGAGEDGAGGYSMITSSDDEGRTWSGPRYILKEAPTPNGFPRSINGTYLWTDPKGRLWWFFPYSLGIFDGRAGIWAAVCEDPDADKLTWGIPRRLADGEYVNKPFILRDSSWLLSATLFPRKCIGVKMGDMKDSDLFTELDSLRMSNFFISKDDGATWERRGGVTAPPDVWDWDEPHFIEKSSGELRTLIRTQHGLCESRSKDGARTWTAPEPSKLLHPNSRIFTMKLQSGKVLLVKHGRLDEKTGRTHLTAYLSDDEGETWRGGLLLEERGCSYPDGIQAPDGRIHIVYDQERHNGRILMATLREEDVRAGKLVSKDTSLKTLVHGAATAPKETKGLPPQD